MRKFFVLLLCVLGLLLISCDDPTAPAATPTPTPTQMHVPAWHVTQHFTSTVVFFGTSLFEPDRSEQVTVTSPWRIAWQAHGDNYDGDGFSLFVCQNVDIGGGASIPDCNALVYRGFGSGITAPITKVYNDVTLSVSIGGVNSTWSFDIEELS